MIQRDVYMRAISRALGRSKITAILGPRQCGKTTLALQIHAGVHNSYMIDLESPSDRAKLQNPELFLSGLPGLIIIDEVQVMPELFPLLRVLADRWKEYGRFLILGSASPELVGHASESLAGRVEFIDLQGFNVTEVSAGTEADAGDPSSNRQKLWVRGGFPLSYLAASSEDSYAWREGFVRTFLEKDIPQLGIRIPSEALRRFWTMLAHAHGQILNSSQLGKSMGLSHTTIRTYIDILASTYMVRVLQPWYENLKKRQVRSPKIYLSDTGILHHLLGIRTHDDLFSHPIIGSSWEGFVIEQLLRTNPSITPYFWSTHSGAEVDLFFIHRGKRIGIECKLNEAPKGTKSMYSAAADLGLDWLFILYPGSESYPVHDSIEVISLEKLLAYLAAG
jgi:uncharacterized protein